jgi:hypothetical protein
MAERKILNSWKEIAGYLGRGVRTIQRYEVEHGFPVRRIEGKNRTAVMAFADEIDAWLRRWHTRLEPSDGGITDPMKLRTQVVLRTDGIPKSDHLLMTASTDFPDGKSSHTVLIVEDENAAVERLQAVLNRLGTFNFEVYCKPTEAIERLQQSVRGEADMPCLIVLDLSFPTPPALPS